MIALHTHPDSWIEQAPKRCSASREIAASPSAVWEVLADHESWPQWFPVVQEMTVTGAASGVGARRRVRLPGLVLEEEFLAWEVGSRYAFRAVSASRRMFASINERVTIEGRRGGGSLVTYDQAFAPSWWFHLPFKVMQRRFRRDLGDAMHGLAGRTESA
ncbi:MAG: SRPBCC family protein [Acidimicrobiia bacterium]